MTGLGHTRGAAMSYNSTLSEEKKKKEKHKLGCEGMAVGLAL